MHATAGCLRALAISRSRMRVTRMTPNHSMKPASAMPAAISRAPICIICTVPARFWARNSILFTICIITCNSCKTCGMRSMRAGLHCSSRNSMPIGQKMSNSRRIAVSRWQAYLVSTGNMACGAKMPGKSNQSTLINLERNVFISNAYAQAAGGGVESSLTSFLPIILMFVVLYFLMIRPQMKRQKEQKSMMDALAKGDEVVTAGGMLGRVTKVADNYVTLEIAAGTEVVVQKASVTTLLPKGTIKAL